MPTATKPARPAASPPPLRPAAALLALALAALAACQVPVSAPELRVVGDPLLQASAPATYAACFAYTMPAQGDVEGFVLERRTLPDGAFERTDTRVYGPEESGSTHCVPIYPAYDVLYAFPAGSPEGGAYEFRLRALPDPGGTRASAPVQVRLAPRSPTLRAFVAGSTFGFDVSCAGCAATALEVTRVASDCSGASRSSTFTLPVAPAHWADPDSGLTFDGLTVWYGVRAVLGGDRSVTVGDGYDGPKTAPTLTASVSGGLLTAVVTNRSGCRVDVTLYRRSTSQAVADQEYVRGLSVPPGAGATAAFTSAAPQGAWNYWLQPSKTFVTDPDQFLGRPAVWFQYPADPAALRGRVALDAPLAVATWLEDGRLAALLSQGAAGPGLTLGPPGQGSALALDPTAYWTGQPDLAALDGAGLPHLLLSQSGLLDHAWFDGDVWRVEVLPSAGTASSARLARGADGTLAASWLSGGLPMVARWDGAAFAASPLGGAAAMADALAVDETGRLHAVTGSTHWFETAAGWSSEATPATGMGSQALVVGAAGLVLAWQDWNRVTWTSDRDAAGWGAPQRIGDGVGAPAPYGSGPVLLARSPDGSRLALANLGQYQLWIRDAAGLTRWTWPHLGAVAALGFTPAGKVRLLAVRDSTVLFEEP